MVATVVELRSSAVAVSYYERDGYYAKNDPEHRQASFWHGAAAKALGLRAHVRPKRFESVLCGPCAGDGHPARAQARGGARAPSRLGHHLLGTEVGVSGGAGHG